MMATARAAGQGWRLALAALLVPLLLSALGGCAVQTQALRDTRPADLQARAELSATPFFPQTAYQCGPAALATVLAAAGLRAQPEELAEQVFLPARTGTLQIEMIAGARRQGAVATRLPPRLEAVLREVQAGHPVVVLLNLGLSWYPVWHYAVLVGYDLEAGDVLLRSGTTQRAVLAMRTFEHTWQRAGAWAFVAVPPGQWPATAELPAAIDAAVGFERAAPPAAAALAYRSALQRWPGDLSLQMGLGNSLHAAGDKRAAAQAFRDATQAHPGSAPAWINLASTLVDLGAPVEALRATDQAIATGDAAWRAQAEAVSNQARAAQRTR
jgi:hypothetical protein